MLAIEQNDESLVWQRYVSAMAEEAKSVTVRCEVCWPGAL
jgi:hypothetical protein